MFKHGFPPEWSTFKKLIWLVGAGIAGASYIWKTLTGALIHITDALASPMQKCEVTLEPIQDLHGQDAPYPAGGGKNICPPLSEWDDGYIDGAGSVHPQSQNFYEKSSPFISVLPNEDYTFSYTFTNNSIDINQYWCCIGFYDENKTFLERYALTYTKSITKAKSNAVYIRVSFRTFNIGNTVQVEKNPTATAYAPYSNICPITGWTGCEVNRTGANLWGGEKLADDSVSAINTPSRCGKGSDSDGNYVFFSASADIDNVPLFSTFKPNTQYTFIYKFRKSANTNTTNLGVRYTDGTVVSISYSSSVTAGNIYYGIFKTNANKSVKSIEGYWASGASYFYYDSCGVFEGDVSSDDFKPYSGTTLSVTFPVDAGTVGKGSVDVVSGEGEATTNILEFDGSEDEQWSKFAAGSARAYAMQIAVPNLMYQSLVTDLKSNYLPTITADATWGNYDYFISMNDNTGIKTGFRSITTEEAWRAYLSEHPLQVHFKLATPTEFSLTPQPISTLRGENNVWSNGDSVEITYKAQA